MAEPICEDEGILQEWAPESKLLQQIPLKIQRGIFSQDLNLTCIDVVQDYIALGTNAGLVYWYCRQSGELQRLRFENSNGNVTQVKVVSTVDFMVAAGTNQGTVAVFQIPKQPPDSVPDALKPKNKQVERFTINGLHNAPITSIEWSQNGMKLFSGDKNGLVVLTEIDFYMHLSKSTELLNEQFEIVQISYNQQTLLISTLLRSIICDGSDRWKVHQVGTKERKILGKFGACLCKFEHGVVVYASRPGHRLWLADRKGAVQQTLIFKSAVQSSHSKIQLINPVNKVLPYDASFGKLLQFGESRLIAYNCEMMYVLHPGAVGVIAVLDCARKILDVSVSRDEVYILEGGRSLLRLGHLPDPHMLDVKSPPSRRTSFIFDEIAARLKGNPLDSLKAQLSSDYIPPLPQNENSPPAMADEAVELPPIVNLPSGSVPQVTADGLTREPAEGQEHDICEEVLSRPVQRRRPKKHRNAVALQGQESESDTTSIASDDRLVWGTANDQSASEESFSISQSSISVLRDIPGLQQSLQSAIAEDKSLASLDTCESVSEHLALNSEHFLLEQERTFLRLANQEASLLDSYHSEKTENMSISLNLSPSSSSISSRMSDQQSTSEISENVSMVSDHSQSQTSDPLPLPKNLCYLRPDGGASSREAEPMKRGVSTETSSVSSENSQNVPDARFSTGVANTRSPETIRLEVRNNEKILSQLLGMDLTGSDTDLRCDSLSEVLEEQGTDENLLPESEQGLVEIDQAKESSDKRFTSMDALNYGPPSGSSNPSLEFNSRYFGEAAPLAPPNDVPPGPSEMTMSQLDLVEPSDRWVTYWAPEPVTSLAVCDEYVVCCDATERVYYSVLSGLSLSWVLLDYEASAVSVSADGGLVWLLTGKKTIRAVIQPSKKGPFSDSMMEVTDNARCFAVDSNCEGWIVRPDGELVCQKNLVRVPCGRTEVVSCEWLVTSVACHEGLVVAITSNETLVCRPRGAEAFYLVTTPGLVVTSVSLGPGDVAWVVDDRSNIFFTDDVTAEQPEWWEVLISEYVFQDTPPPNVFPYIHNKLRLNTTRPNVRLKSTHIASNGRSLWIFDRFSSTIYVNKTDFTGYIWRPMAIRSSLGHVRWQALCGEGVFEDKGHLWLLSGHGDVFCAKPNAQEFQAIPSPCSDVPVCIASSTDTLWVLSSDGRVYARLGLTDHNLMGNTWRELNLPQMRGVRLAWVSCGCDVAWGCDDTGRVYITIGSPHLMATNIFDAAWLEVEDLPKDKAPFRKVFVGPQLHMVWAVDVKNDVYVREGIFPHFQIGTGWVYVTGIKVIHLTVSGTAVWALATSGHVYRRHGISESNYIGDYWKRIPGKLQTLTSSFTETLWGVDESGRVVRLKQNTKVLNHTTDAAPASEDSDWEVVQ